MKSVILQHLQKLLGIKGKTKTTTKDKKTNKPATLLKVTLLHGCFTRFLNCTNGSKSRTQRITYYLPIAVFLIEDVVH